MCRLMALLYINNSLKVHSLIRWPFAPNRHAATTTATTVPLFVIAKYVFNSTDSLLDSNGADRSKDSMQYMHYEYLLYFRVKTR